MSSASGKRDLYSCCMKELGKGIPQEPEVEVLTGGEILPPLRPEPETQRRSPEAGEPVVHLNLTQINEMAKTDPDIALTYIVNFQPVVEVEAKHPIEELFEKATEGLLTGADKTVHGAASLMNYRSRNRASVGKPTTQLRSPGGGKASHRP